MVQVVQQQQHPHPQHLQQQRRSNSSRTTRTWWSSSASWISSLLYSGRRRSRKRSTTSESRGLGGLPLPRYGNGNNVNNARRRKTTTLIILLFGLTTLYLLILLITTTPIQPHHLYESKNNNKKPFFLSSILGSSSISSSMSVGHDPSPRTNPTTLKDSSFRILCTSTNKKIEWGSYQIRCRDLKSWAERCTSTVAAVGTGSSGSSGGKGGGVYVVTDLSFSDMYRRRWIRWWLGQLRPEEQYEYDATIFIKAFPSVDKLLPNVFGNNLFVDLVDEYKYKGDQIPRQYKLIAQTSWQGYEKFPNHETSTVEHWYNSYPQDMLKSEQSTYKSNNNNNHNHDDYPDGMPVIVDPEDTDSQRSCLHLATIWNTKRDKGPHEGGCPALSKRHSSLNITYDCLDLEFDISKWYLDYILGEPGQGTTTATMPQVNSHDHHHDHLDYHSHHYHNPKFHSIAEARVDMATTLRDPMLGPGKLYYNIFQNYDVLVVLTKNDTEKLHYGNVQRTISQMRSGVPVLVDVRGRVLEDFMDKYNYTCAFQRYPDHDDHDNGVGSSGGGDGKNSTRRKYWTFDEAVEQMRNAEIRRQCQRQGLDIVKDYSPSKIGQKFLRTVGYNGDFVC